MRILVTGGAGFIGSHVVDRLIHGGHAVAVVDNLSSGRRAHVHRDATLHVCDIRSARLANVVAGCRPEAVVHVAAQAAVGRSVIDPVFDASVNLLGTLTLLEACRRGGVGRVIYTSTGGAAYGDTDVLPTPEDHPTRATSPYGVSKVTAERYLEVWAELTGGRAISLRLANVYGPRQSPHGEAGVVAIFTHRLLGGEPCIINGDGEQTRDYVCVDDVVEAVALAVARDEAVGVVNVATGTETSVNELYRRLSRLARVERAPVHGPARPGEQRRSVLDAGRAKAVLGWTPTIALDEGLARALAHFTGRG